MAELLVERRNGYELWTLNRESARNALSRGLVRELREQTARVREARTLRAVVITGAGEHAFCSGADLKERQTMSEEEVRLFLDELNSALRDLERSDRIFIAAVNGAALGGGTELALACDLRVASPRARFGLTEVTLGIIPGAGGTQRLPRLVGPGRAKELILTGRWIGAEEACTLGLVQRVTTGRLLDEAGALAEALVANAPVALAAAKHAIDGGRGLPLDEGLAVERREYERTLGTRDRLEGLAAFREKRAARFTGE